MAYVEDRGYDDKMRQRVRRIIDEKLGEYAQPRTFRGNGIRMMMSTEEGKYTPMDFAGLGYGTAAGAAKAKKTRQHAKRSAAAKKAAAKNPWVAFYRKWRKEHPEVPGKDAMKRASAAYKEMKGSAIVGGARVKAKYGRHGAPKKLKVKHAKSKDIADMLASMGGCDDCDEFSEVEEVEGGRKSSAQLKKRADVRYYKDMFKAAKRAYHGKGGAGDTIGLTRAQAFQMLKDSVRSEEPWSDPRFQALVNVPKKLPVGVLRRFHKDIMPELKIHGMKKDDLLAALEGMFDNMNTKWATRYLDALSRLPVKHRPFLAGGARAKVKYGRNGAPKKARVKGKSKDIAAILAALKK